MADDDWHRRTTWTDEDQQAFFARFARCRTDSTRTQSLRIQAMTLNRHGNPTAALELLDKLLREFPDDYFRGLTYSERADCHCALGAIEAAIADYRAALALQYGECPNVRTDAWLELPWFIVEHSLSDLFDEALQIVERGEQEVAREQTTSFPLTVYICESVKAVISHERGDDELAKRFARAALDSCSRSHSGLVRHPGVGLVGPDRKSSSTHQRVKRLSE